MEHFMVALNPHPIYAQSNGKETSEYFYKHAIFLIQINFKKIIYSIFLKNNE
jgi:hypothetical protein